MALKRRNPFLAAEAVVQALLDGKEVWRQHLYAVCEPRFTPTEVDAALRFLVDCSVVNESRDEDDAKTYQIAKCEPAYFVRALSMFLRPMQLWGGTAGYDIAKSIHIAVPLLRAQEPPQGEGAPKTAPKAPDAPRANGAAQESAPAPRLKARKLAESLRGAKEAQPVSVNATGNFCSACGGVLVPNGTCEMCTNCGSTTGCSG